MNNNPGNSHGGAQNPGGFESAAGEQEFLEHVLHVMSRASLSDLTARVIIPNTMPRDSIGYKLASGLNVLLRDLENQQKDRVKRLAEETLAKSDEVKSIVAETQGLILEMQELNRLSREARQNDANPVD